MKQGIKILGTAALCGLALILAMSTANSEWKMQVHTYEGINEYFVSEVDSVTFYDDSGMPGMVLVPAGSFIMGAMDQISHCGQGEHEVMLTHDFYLGQHEVTNQEFIDALQWAYDNGYVTATTYGAYDNLDGSTALLAVFAVDGSEVQFDGAGTFYLRESPETQAQIAYPNGYEPADHPVIEVTWFGAARYCDWLSLQAGLPRAYAHTGDWTCNGGDPYGAQGYRLPTDAEWEYAAQFNDDRTYPWGFEETDCSQVNYRLTDPPNPIYCIGWSTPVGAYPDAPAELGLSDMAGNVWELCNDWLLCDLGQSPEVDPVGPASGEDRVIRGGGWETTINALRCAVRYNQPPGGYVTWIGFRTAMTAGTP
jgi:formylglycine-generating enzyme required for sulfatase activity